MSYESCNRTTIRFFKGNELMCDESCDGNHCGDPTSLITSMPRQNYFENNWGVVCFVQFIHRVCVLKCFLGWTWIRRKRPWWTLRSLGLGGKYTRFECCFKFMLIPHGWSILSKIVWPWLVSLWFYLGFWYNCVKLFVVFYSPDCDKPFV